MRLFKSPALLVIIGIIIMITLSYFMILRQKDIESNGVSQQTLTPSVQSTISGDIICPLAIDECAFATVENSGEQSTYSVLNFKQTASSSLVNAVFSGKLEVVSEESGYKVFKIINEELGLEAEYTLGGVLINPGEIVSKGQVIGIVLNNSDISDSSEFDLSLSLHSLESGERLLFEKDENGAINLY